MDSDELSSRARGLMIDPDNEVYLSAISAWEIAVKHRLGRLGLAESPERLVPRLREKHGVRELPLDEASALRVERLPDLHRDPFDRILVCQAIVDGLVILTPDEMIRRYPVVTEW